MIIYSVSPVDSCVPVAPISNLDSTYYSKLLQTRKECDYGFLSLEDLEYLKNNSKDEIDSGVFFLAELSAKSGDKIYLGE